MYLTRMELNTKNRDTMHLLSSPEKIHGLVESAFQGERKRNLWRIERLRGKLYLLILSPDQPDLKDGVERYGFPQYPEACQTKDYMPLLMRVKKDTWWHFKLVANPTRSCSLAEGERGHVKAHTSVHFQKEWLLKRAEKHGFELLPENFQVWQSDWKIFEKGCTYRRKAHENPCFERGRSRTWTDSGRDGSELDFTRWNRNQCTGGSIETAAVA